MTLRRSDSERNHCQHQALMRELKALDSALNGLVCYPEVYADLGTAEQIYRCGRKLRDVLPTAQAADLESAVEELKECGRELAQDLTAHMSTEERRLSIIPKHS